MFTLDRLQQIDDELIDLKHTERLAAFDADSKLVFRLLNVQILAYFFLRDFEKATELINRMESLMESFIQGKQMILQVWIGRYYCSKGKMSRYQKETERAIQYYQQSLEIAETLKSGIDIGRCLVDLARIYREQGDFPQSLVQAERLFSIAKSAGGNWNLGFASNSIGITFHVKGDVTRALKYYQQSVDFYKQIGLIQRIGSPLMNMGILYLYKGELDLALEVFQEMLELEKSFDRKFYGMDEVEA